MTALPAITGRSEEKLAAAATTRLLCDLPALQVSSPMASPALMAPPRLHLHTTAVRAHVVALQAQVIDRPRAACRHQDQAIQRDRSAPSLGTSCMGVIVP